MNNHESNIPIVTKIGEPDGDGWVQFTSNDPKKYAAADSMAGNYSLRDNPNGDSYEVTAKKISGFYNEPFGMIFCGSDSAFYQLNINLDSRYNVIRQAVSGNGTTSGEVLIPWTKSNHLEEGYNRENSVKAVKNGNVVTLFFNGQEENSFTEPNPLNGKKIGLAVHYGKEGQENFPEIPVDVRFLVK